MTSAATTAKNLDGLKMFTKTPMLTALELQIYPLAKIYGLVLGLSPSSGIHRAAPKSSTKNPGHKAEVFVV
jgi:hypothetical protein